MSRVVDVTMTRIWRKTAPRDGVEQRVMNGRILATVGSQTDTFARRDGTEGSRTVPVVYAVFQMEGDTRVFPMTIPLTDLVFPRFGKELEGLDVLDGKPLDGRILQEKAVEAQTERIGAAAAATALVPAAEGAQIGIADLLGDAPDDASLLATEPAPKKAKS